MATYKCPWCTSKSSFKSSVQSHMQSCARKPAKYRSSGSGMSYSNDDSDILLTALVMESLIDSCSDSSSSYDSGSSYSSSSYDSGSSCSSDSGSCGGGD